MMDGNRDWTKIIRTAVMILIYFAMFVLVAYTDIFIDLFRGNKPIQYGFAAIFLIYGLFRAYRLWKEIKSE